MTYIAAKAMLYGLVRVDSCRTSPRNLHAISIDTPSMDAQSATTLESRRIMRVSGVMKMAIRSDTTSVDLPPGTHHPTLAQRGSNPFYCNRSGRLTPRVRVGG